MLARPLASWRLLWSLPAGLLLTGCLGDGGGGGDDGGSGPAAGGGGSQSGIVITEAQLGVTVTEPATYTVDGGPPSTVLSDSHTTAPSPLSGGATSLSWDLSISDAAGNQRHARVVLDTQP